MTMSGKEFVDYYALLGVAQNDDLAAIRKAFLLKAKAIHPDAGGSTEEMQAVNLAYTTLSNDLSRRAYDQVYVRHMTGDELDFKFMHESVTPTGKGDELADDFVDELFNEFYATKSIKKRPIRKFIRTILQK